MKRILISSQLSQLGFLPQHDRMIIDRIVLKSLGCSIYTIDSSIWLHWFGLLVFLQSFMLSLPGILLPCLEPRSTS
jgi:hypothetical protein